MTRERIEDFREIVLPFLRNVLLKTNYENLGKSDAEEFTRDFNEILELAIKALENDPLIVPIAEFKYDEDKLKELVNKAVLTVTPQEPRWISVSEKYEHHIDHTDCIWYGNDNGCPVTCSQYRDGWNDAMDYIFKNGDGYRPYRRNENG